MLTRGETRAVRVKRQSIRVSTELRRRLVEAAWAPLVIPELTPATAGAAAGAAAGGGANWATTAPRRPMASASSRSAAASAAAVVAGSHPMTAGGCLRSTARTHRRSPSTAGSTAAAMRRRGAPRRRGRRGGQQWVSRVGSAGTREPDRAFGSSTPGFLKRSGFVALPVPINTTDVARFVHPLRGRRPLRQDDAGAQARRRAERERQSRCLHALPWCGRPRPRADSRIEQTRAGDANRPCLQRTPAHRPQTATRRSVR